MPLYSVRRRTFNSPNVEPVNLRRGMFRIWVLMSAAWIMGWVIYLIMYGLRGGFQVTGEVLVVPVLLLGPPVALMLFGLGAAWAFRGFKVDEGQADEDRPDA
jgi:hypothetical protein